MPFPRFVVEHRNDSTRSIRSRLARFAACCIALAATCWLLIVCRLQRAACRLPFAALLAAISACCLLLDLLFCWLRVVCSDSPLAGCCSVTPKKKGGRGTRFTYAGWVSPGSETNPPIPLGHRRFGYSTINTKKLILRTNYIVSRPPRKKRVTRDIPNGGARSSYVQGKYLFFSQFLRTSTGNRCPIRMLSSQEHADTT